MRIPKELHYDPALWARLREAARRTGVQAVFPIETGRGVRDDHRPFLDLDVPAMT